MEWPTQSPDLNPMENAWSVLKDRLEIEEIHGMQNLWEKCQDLWMAIPRETITNLIASMPRRVQAVIRAGGGPIYY